ncbi:MAG: DUF3301 domain-containing protein [Chromatiaceae bacterium]|jgi:hypothetical protein|nr:DUF3301 domain-containing protein [Chromatiaceae bacterium]
MINSLLPFLALLLLAWVWLDGARAREFATVLARRYCEHRGLQFLDETVSLARIGIRWTNQGLRIRRMFRFDFSLEGVGRRTGHVLMLGNRLETIDDGLPKVPVAATPVDATQNEPVSRSDDGKVVPFRRKEH